MKNWIEKLEPGDNVIYEGDIRCVDRITKTMVILKNHPNWSEGATQQRFRRCSGFRVKYSGVLLEATKERVDEIMHRTCCTKISDISWRKLSLDQLYKVLELVGPIITDKYFEEIYERMRQEYVSK